jgi:hypothetical protein
MEALEASIQDLARVLGGPAQMGSQHRPEPAALEVEITVIQAADPLDDPWFTDDDSIVVITDDVYQLSRSTRFHTTWLDVALVLVFVACATLG